ncbi:hypothetical protein DICVIV_04930 [Dictyocaulus viviparus]|uniref:Uncharacterized protein n=1 Tax=Dictyocaulus viviparus TaxID=29172 RepID=A0A0D8XWR9_DICVI|nr:hypothetical protein DICVIV_04930 [Dictyocaulus viviparus]
MATKQTVTHHLRSKDSMKNFKDNAVSSQRTCGTCGTTRSEEGLKLREFACDCKRLFPMRRSLQILNPSAFRLLIFSNGIDLDHNGIRSHKIILYYAKTRSKRQLYARNLCYRISNIALLAILSYPIDNHFFFLSAVTIVAFLYESIWSLV